MRAGNRGVASTLGVELERELAANHGPALFARELEAAVEGSDAVVHARQAPAEGQISRHPLAVIGNLVILCHG